MTLQIETTESPALRDVSEANPQTFALHLKPRCGIIHIPSALSKHTDETASKGTTRYMVAGPRRQSVTKEKASLAKRMLFQGKAQTHVAAVLGVSQASISRLKSGHLYPEIAWPNGASGEIPIEDMRHSASLKWSDQAGAYQKLPEILQVRILEIVNVQRAASDLLPIPEMALVYTKYLEVEDGDFDAMFERPPIEVAQLAEDQRISMLMDEFHKIIDIDMSFRREQDTIDILKATQDSQEDEPPHRAARPLVYRKLEWDEVVQRASHLDIVKKAIHMEDIHLQEACSIAFYELRRSNEKTWANAALNKEIWKIRDRLEEDVTLGVKE